jgi:hypothetical protein
VEKWVKQLKTILEISVRECAWCGIWEHCISATGRICPCKECIVKVTCGSTCEKYEKYYDRIVRQRKEEIVESIMEKPKI